MEKATVKILDESNGTVMLNNVRLGFKCLWKENIYEGRPTGRQVAQFLFEDDETEEYRKLEGVALRILQGVDKSIRSVDEAENERFAEYHGKQGEHNWVFRTSNSQQYPALYINEAGMPDRTTPPDQIEDKVLYAGCRVNAKVQMGARPSTRKRGKTCLWPNLVAIQFAGHDKPIGGPSDQQVAEGFGKGGAVPQTAESGFGAAPAPEKKVDIDDMLS